MKRYLYLFPLMAITAATFTLGACDDKKKADDQTTSTTESTMPDSTAVATPPVAAPVVEQKIVASGASAFSTAPGATTGAAFMIIDNKQAEADKLIAVKTDIPGTTAELHENTMDPATNVMSMRKVNSVDIPANGRVTLKPDGYHVMVMGLTSPLTPTTPFNVTLTFEKAGDVMLPVSVLATTAPSQGAEMPMGTAPSTPSSSPDASSDVAPPSTTPSTAAPAVTSPETSSTSEAPEDDQSTAAPTSSTVPAPEAAPEPAPSTDEHPAE